MVTIQFTLAASPPVLDYRDITYAPVDRSNLLGQISEAVTDALRVQTCLYGSQ